MCWQFCHCLQKELSSEFFFCLTPLEDLLLPVGSVGWYFFRASKSPLLLSVAFSERLIKNVPHLLCFSSRQGFERRKASVDFCETTRTMVLNVIGEDFTSDEMSE